MLKTKAEKYYPSLGRTPACATPRNFSSVVGVARVELAAFPASRDALTEVTQVFTAAFAFRGGNGTRTRIRLTRQASAQPLGYATGFVLVSNPKIFTKNGRTKGVRERAVGPRLDSNQHTQSVWPKALPVDAKYRAQVSIARAFARGSREMEMSKNRENSMPASGGCLARRQPHHEGEAISRRVCGRVGAGTGRYVARHAFAN